MADRLLSPGRHAVGAAVWGAGRAGGGGYTGLRWWRGQGSRRSGRRFRCAEGAPSKPNAANIVVATGWPPCRIPLLAAKGYGLTGKCFMARRQLFLLIRNLLVEYGLKWIILC